FDELFVYFLDFAPKAGKRAIDDPYDLAFAHLPMFSHTTILFSCTAWACRAPRSMPTYRPRQSGAAFAFATFFWRQLSSKYEIVQTEGPRTVRSCMKSCAALGACVKTP